MLAQQEMRKSAQSRGPVLRKSHVHLVPPAQSSSWGWMAGAATSGLMLAVPFVFDLPLLAAIGAAGAAAAVWYVTSGRNDDAWRTLVAGPSPIEGAPLREVLGHTRTPDSLR